LLPRTQVEFSVGDRDDHLSAHDLAFEVGVGIVFAGSVVVVLRRRRVRGQFFEPDFVIVVKAAFVVVDETDAVMCIALQRQRPSLTPLLSTSSSMVSVMLTNPRLPFTSNQRYSVSDFIPQNYRLAGQVSTTTFAILSTNHNCSPEYDPLDWVFFE